MPPSAAVGWQGVWSLLAQQSWLMPPFLSAHTFGPPGFVGSSTMAKHASPVQVAEHAAAPQLFGWAWFGHAGSLVLLVIPVVRSRSILSLAIGGPWGGHCFERKKVVGPVGSTTST